MSTVVRKSSFYLYLGEFFKQNIIFIQGRVFFGTESRWEFFLILYIFCWALILLMSRLYVEDAKVSAKQVKATLSDRGMWSLNENFHFFGAILPSSTRFEKKNHPVNYMAFRDDRMLPLLSSQHSNRDILGWLVSNRNAVLFRDHCRENRDFYVTKLNDICISIKGLNELFIAQIFLVKSEQIGLFLNDIGV